MADTNDTIASEIKHQQERGDAAKLREALEAIDKNTDLLDIAEDIAPKLHPSHSFVAVQIRKIVRAALSAPPRNCDVGTVAEQSERMDKFCNSHGHGFDGYRTYTCENCKFISVDKCELAWAQMPYVEKEGGANG